MERFIERHQGQIVGVLSGFDRLLFRGSLRSISYVKGMDAFLASQDVLYKDFGRFARRLSTRLCQHAEKIAHERGRPMQYVAAPSASKEEIALKIAKRDDVREGLICVLTCVEPCQSFDIRGDRASGHLQLIQTQRKCTHVYFYFIDPEFGFMHVRLQTWLPFSIQVCINGREYLARQLDRAGIGYERRDNCFARIDDLPRAQRMLARLEKRSWSRVLSALGRRVNPLITGKSGLDLHGYYWSTRQSEYATDVMFRDAASLQALYPRLADHAIQQFSCRDIMRFLERRTNNRFSGSASGTLVPRGDGLRVRHWVEENSIKMYDKQGSVLRVETTMNNPRRFKIRRLGVRKGCRRMSWLPLRKGVADIARQAEICRSANARYLDALAVVTAPMISHQVLDPVSQPVVCKSRRHRALRPVSREEAAIFRVMLRGEFAIQGFRNRDLRTALLAVDEQDRAARRKASGQITRLLITLRAHGLIYKVSHTRYYRITKRGQQVMTTALKLRDANVSLLAA